MKRYLIRKSKMSSFSQALKLTQYWHLLSDMDKYQYSSMRVNISSDKFKNQRNKRIENCKDIMLAIKAFCLQGNNDDWKRCLVCGMFWHPDGIGINTHQLRTLIFKCKSSINGSLQKLGFDDTLGRTETANAIVRMFPILKDRTSEIRQWTIRRYAMRAKISLPKPLVEPIINMTSVPEPDIESCEMPLEIRIPDIHDLGDYTLIDSQISPCLENSEIWDIQPMDNLMQLPAWE